MRCFFVFLILSFLFPNYLDGVIAVVGNKAVLKSDVLDQAYMLASQKNISPSDPRFERVFDAVLQEKVHRLIVLNSAEKDTSIVVSYSEINTELDSRIDYFLNSFGSESALEEAMGMNVGDIKDEYWETVREELMVDRFRYSLFGNISVSSDEVESFYKEYKDSLPPSPSLFDFSVLELSVDIGFGSKDSLYLKAVAVRDSLVSGLLDFSVAVERYSDDPGSVKSGGDLGLAKRGTFVPSYEKAAFSLNVGEYSDVVESSFGFHIIYLVNRLGEKIHTKHILFSLLPSEKDNLLTKDKLVSLFGFVEKDPALMDSLALEFFSKHKNNSGVYRDFPSEKIPQSLLLVLENLQDYSFSDVFYSNGSYFLCYRRFFVEGKKSTLSNNWVLVESLALNKKMSDLFQEWVEKQLDFVYVKVFNY